VRFIALSFFFYVSNVAPFDAGTLKLQRMIKWDVFLNTVYIYICSCVCVCVCVFKQNTTRSW